jgi:uncharacterized membrane protein YidH (DUF202 family)
VVIAAVALSFAPSVVGEPSGETARFLLHVVRPVGAVLLLVAALGVQIGAGVLWRRRLRADDRRADLPEDPAPHRR